MNMAVVVLFVYLQAAVGAEAVLMAVAPLPPMAPFRSRRTHGPRCSPSACQQTRWTWCATGLGSIDPTRHPAAFIDATCTRLSFWQRILMAVLPATPAAPAGQQAAGVQSHAALHGAGGDAPPLL